MTKELMDERCDFDLSEKFMYNGLPRGVKRKMTSNGNSAPNKHARTETNGINGNHADDEDDEENDWSEDEDGFDNIPMEVCISHPTIPKEINLTSRSLD